jgi:hypothetical protein
MEKQKEEENLGQELFYWQIPEYDKHPRARSWYILASGIAVVLLLSSMTTGNFLFAVIIIVASLIIILHDGKEPDKVDFKIMSEGIVVGRRFYDYDEIKNFSIIYKPREEVQNLYFEFNGFIKPRLSIPLENMNPLQIRETLLKYLREDLERKNRPTSETLAKLLRL